MKLGYSDSKHPILHGSLNLIHLGILRQPEPPHELAAAPFNPVPRIILVFLLHVPLPTYLQHPIIYHFHFHFFFLKPRHIGLEHVGFRGFLPVDPGVDKG
ncbi:hypothetical protein E1A91_D02G076300v1 [Gossypium mustelinum]|uniref:Uncharacterized protein n=1 Tax=Gossypium mustelinum TaxID=34275 RepID=A0A5D2VTP4_GOSMU|nr:hypothetical protein E1A91_D02G076300v1 [Gossypium mustelinum]